MMENMLRLVREQAEIIRVLQEELQKVKASKEPVDGGGSIYEDPVVGRSKGIVARRSNSDSLAPAWSLCLYRGKGPFCLGSPRKVVDASPRAYIGFAGLSNGQE